MFNHIHRPMINLIVIFLEKGEEIQTTLADVTWLSSE